MYLGKKEKNHKTLFYCQQLFDLYRFRADLTSNIAEHVNESRHTFCKRYTSYYT